MERFLDNLIREETPIVNVRVVMLVLSELQLPETHNIQSHPPTRPPPTQYENRNLCGNISVLLRPLSGNIKHLKLTESRPAGAAGPLSFYWFNFIWGLEVKGHFKTGTTQLLGLRSASLQPHQGLDLALKLIISPHYSSIFCSSTIFKEIL